MKAWLMDVYRAEESIILWIKTKQGDVRIKKDCRGIFYSEPTKKIEQLLKKLKLNYCLTSKKNYLGKLQDVFEINTRVADFEKIVGLIERKNNYAVRLYDADIKPEQRYLYEAGLTPCSAVEIKGKNIKGVGNDTIALKKLNLIIVGRPIKKILFNTEVLAGGEEELLCQFVDKFNELDPDVILMQYAFSHLPYLVKKLAKYNLKCKFHRWDEAPIKYNGGRSFYSYGAVRYRDYAIRLRGRFLVDASTTVGEECDIEGIIELCQLSGCFFQQIASRSFGAVFQMALVRQMIKENLLVPYKEKPIAKPINLADMIKADRVGHTFDPKVGLHKNVAEIDFSSMYPWIIYNQNISAETLLAPGKNAKKVPGLPLFISDKKGIVPVTIKPFLDRRMYYKKNKSALNNAKAKGLKWVLVTSYGYLRFREFKLGLASCHMAIGAFARQILITAAKKAEQRGFEVVHGIIDSLYLKKKNISEEEVKSFCYELEREFNIPISFEGIFKWMVFLPSINDPKRPVPTNYYGVFDHGGLKARGIELRKRNTPMVVKYFQQKCLEEFSKCKTKKEIVQKVVVCCKLIREIVNGLKRFEADWLTHKIYLSKTDYKTNIHQKKIVDALRKKNVAVKPGQVVKYLIQQGRVILPEQYRGFPDKEYYKKLLIRSMYNIVGVFGIKESRIIELAGEERQTLLKDYTYVKHVYVPIANKYRTRKGLAEKSLRKRLEKQGWIVWRGGLINIIRRYEVYPNVRRKYTLLNKLLVKNGYDAELLQYYCVVHHGMPDFVCFRNGKFKFVECKLCHEQLSKRQKKCILKLQEIGFKVEVHKLVEACTKTREANVNLETGAKRLIEKQTELKVF